jgi:hypothetical protein
MRVKFIRLFERIESGRVAEVDEETYERARNHCIILPEEIARAEPVKIDAEAVDSENEIGKISFEQKRRRK